MKATLLFSFLILTTTSTLISASLSIVQFQPLVFQLQFSENLSIPSFQLILNNVYQLNYTLLTANNPSDIFHFQASPHPPPSGQFLQNYNILFTQPLSIGSGRLLSSYFKLSAQTDRIEIVQPEIWGYLLVIAGYLLINFGFFGMILIEFLEVYCLVNFKTKVHTELFHTISKGLLMLNPNPTETGNELLYVELCLPPLLMILAAAIGYLVKRYVREKESIARKIFYDIFVYDTLVCTGLVFILPSFFNSIYFLNIKSYGQPKIDPNLSNFGMFFCYLGIITPLALIYLFLYSLNPKVGQSEESWKKYLEGDQYQSFRRLHSVLKKERWYTRNKNVIMKIKLLVIACLFFLPIGFQFYIFMLEFVHIFFVFMVQPYKEEVYMNILSVCRLLMLSYYGIRVVGNFYFSMGPAVVNYSKIKSFLVACDVIFLLVCLCLIIAIFYEIYVKCSHLKYQVRLVREENQFKIKLVERRVTGEVHSRVKKIDRHESQKSQIYQERQNYSYSTRNRNRDPTSLRRPTKISHLSASKKHSLMLYEQDLTPQPPAKQEELQNQNTRNNAKTIISNESKESNSKREKIKWKKSSFLVQILKEQ